MVTPVTTDDLTQGVVKFLAGCDDILAVLGTYPATDTPLLFQHHLWTAMESSQSTAAVLSTAGGWAGGNEHNTLRFPRLSLEIYADPLRDPGNNITDPGEVHRRIAAAFTAFDARLHRPQNGTQMWGAVRVISCIRQTEPLTYVVPDGGGLLRQQTFYAVEQG